MAGGRPLRILYHHRTLSGDGQAVHIEAMVEAFRHAGHVVHLVAPSQAQGAGHSRDGMMARLRKALPRRVSERLEIAYSRRAALRLARAVRQFRPDVIYERYSLFLTAGIEVAQQAKIPLILEVNAPLADERRDHGGLALYGRAKSIEADIWRQADHVLPVSRVLADMVREAGAAPERVTVIPNGVFETAIASTLPVHTADRVNLAFVGFARQWHRLDRVLETIATPDMAHVRLTVIGDGDVVPDLRAQAETLGIGDRFEVTGDIPTHAVTAALKNAHIGLLPAVTAYASPLKLFDYMAAGLAIFAPDQPNIRDIVEDGRSAVFADPDDPAHWQAQLRRLACDADLRETLSRGAHARLHDSGYLWSENANRVEAVARQLINAA